MKDWNDLTDQQKNESIEEYKTFIESEVEIQKIWIGETTESRNDKLREFILFNGRLPLIGEIE